MSVVKIALVFTLVLTLGACASKPKNNKQSQRSFETEIKDDGSKRFTALIVITGQSESRKSDTRGSGDRGGDKRQGGRKGGGGQRGGAQSEQRSASAANLNEADNQENREQILAFLNQEIEKTKYCRHGYIELDYTSLKGETEFKGECQESASNEDKARWE